MKNLILLFLFCIVSFASFAQSSTANIVYGQPVILTSRTNDTTSIYLKTATKNITGIAWNAGNGKIEYRLPQDSIIIHGDSLFYKNSSGYKYLVALLSGSGGVETDPVFLASAAHNITSANIVSWNNVYNWYNSNGWSLYTPSSFVPITRTLNINGTVLDLSQNRSWTITAGSSIDSTKLTLQNAYNKSITAGETNPNIYTGTNRLYVSGQDANQVIHSASSITGRNYFLTVNAGSESAGLVAGVNSWILLYDHFHTGLHSGLNFVLTDTSGNGDFVPRAAALGSNTFASLSDVNLTSISNNQLVKYNSTASKWENFTPSYLTSYTETDPFALKIANNLSDLASTVTARANLGLGSLATLNSINNSNWSGTALVDANISSSANWNTAYNKFVASGSYSGGTLTLTRNDATTLSISGFSGGGLTNPMTAANDIIVGGASGTPTRLGVGSNGQLLGVVGGNLVYTSIGITDTLAHTIYGKTNSSQVVKLSLADTVASTSTSWQNSPFLEFNGTGWSTATGSSAVKAQQGLIIDGAGGSSGNTHFLWNMPSQSTPGAVVEAMRLYSTGQLNVAGPVSAPSLIGNVITSSITTGGGPAIILTTTSQVNAHGNINADIINIGSTATTVSYYNGMVIKPVYNQPTGSVANSDFIIDRTETAVSSGLQRFISLRISGTEKFGVDNKGNVQVYRPLATNGSTPSYTLGTGSGTSATASISGNDIAGYITVNTGTSPTAGGNVITVTFTTALANTPTSIQLRSCNEAGTISSGILYPDQSTASTTSWIIKSISTTALPASTTLKFYYNITQ